MTEIENLWITLNGNKVQSINTWVQYPKAGTSRTSKGSVQIGSKISECGKEIFVTPLSYKEDIVL